MTYLGNHPFKREPSAEDIADTDQAAKLVYIRNKAAEIEDSMVELEQALHGIGYKPWSDQVWAGKQLIQQIGQAINDELNSTYDHVMDLAEDANLEGCK